MSKQEAWLILTTVPVARTNGLIWRLESDDMAQGFVELQGTPCPFWNAETHCTIYEIRPYNCRRFQCLRGDGEPFEPGGPAGCLNASDRLVQSKAARQEYRANQHEAQKWGAMHGWSAQRESKTVQ